MNLMLLFGVLSVELMLVHIETGRIRAAAELLNAERRYEGSIQDYLSEERSDLWPPRSDHGVGSRNSHVAQAFCVFMDVVDLENLSINGLQCL